MNGRPVRLRSALSRHGTIVRSNTSIRKASAALSHEYRAEGGHDSAEQQARRDQPFAFQRLLTPRVPLVRIAPGFPAPLPRALVVTAPFLGRCSGHSDPPIAPRGPIGGSAAFL